MHQEISVFFPAYNEEENIKKAVIDTDLFLKKNFRRYEIIVVNNGSNDRTKKIVQELMHANKKIKLVNILVNQGYGKGLRAGFAKAKYKYIFYTDADNQFNIKELTLLMPSMKKYDIVCGYRKKRQDPLIRIFIATVYNIIINLLFRLNIKDIDCSFKLFKKAVFDKIKIFSNTGFIDAEVLIKAKKRGFAFAPQIGVTHYPRTLGKTTYEIGPRGKVFAFVKPQVIFDVLLEIKQLWKDLK
jgi:glycosyltransferase involved in cell wall biosynthesis